MFLTSAFQLNFILLVLILVSSFKIEIEAGRIGFNMFPSSSENILHFTVK